MNKRAYIFCLIVLFLGFVVSYRVGVKLGEGNEQEILEQQVNGNPETSAGTPTEGYWVRAVDNIIFVYKHDGTTVIAETDIDISNLSEQEKSILEHGVYLESAEELFKYLEANTS